MVAWQNTLSELVCSNTAAATDAKDIAKIADRIVELLKAWFPMGEANENGDGSGDDEAAAAYEMHQDMVTTVTTHSLTDTTNKSKSTKSNAHTSERGGQRVFKRDMDYRGGGESAINGS